MGKKKAHKSKKKGIAEYPKPDRVNPFDLHYNNRKKFNILGQSSKGTKGLPGISRQKATEWRKKTLLVDYLNRNKSNVFIDKRLGEHDKNATEQEKMDMRRMEEMRQNHNKHTMYNLADDTILTHDGEPLAEHNLNMPISDDEDLAEDGMIDAKFVREQHFGGIDPPSEDKLHHGTEKYKSQKDKIDEIIAECKKKKHEVKQQKDEYEQNLKDLDNQFSDFLRGTHGSSITYEEATKAEKAGQTNFDLIMRTLNMDGGKVANPSDRLKTDEEKAKEESERLTNLEEERLARMKGDFESVVSKVATKSVDTLDEGLIKQFAESAPMVYKEGKLVREGEEWDPNNRKKLNKKEKKELKKQTKLDKQRREEDERLEEELYESEEEMKDEEQDKNNTTQNSEGDEEDAESDDEDDAESDDEDDKESDEDNYSDIMEEGESDEEEGSANEQDDKDSMGNKSSSKKESKKKKRVSFLEEDNEIDKIIKDKLMKAASEELPYTFEVPKNFEGFWSLLQGRTPEEVNTIVSRMIASNHPQMKHSNLVKCSDIFSYILQTLQVLCDPVSMDCPTPEQGSGLRYLDSFVPHLYTLMKFQPADAAKALMLVFIEKRDEYRSKVKKRYPMLDTTIFLHVSGMLFPGTDFFHPLMTPVKLLLIQLLGEAKMKDARGLLVGMHTANLLHKNNRGTGRYICELLVRMQGLLLRSIPVDILATHDDTKCPGGDHSDCSIPLHWLLHQTLPHHDMLPLHNTEVIPTTQKFFMSMANDESLELTDGLRCSVLLTVMKILTDLCKDWDQLPSIREIMCPLRILLRLLPINRYPSDVQEAKKQLEEAVYNLPPHPPRLTIDKGRPKPLRMYEPEIIEMKVSAKSRGKQLNQQQLVEEKLLHYTKRERKVAQRELVKNTKFLAKHKLKEQIASDKERKKKVNLIMNELGHQESRHQQYQKMKPGARR